MNNPHSDTPEALLPWYKQFWFCFVFGLPAVVVIAAIGTVILAFNSADSMVSDNYYKQGLAINALVADINHAKALDLSADIHIDKKTYTWQIKLNSNKALSTGNLIVNLHHPADSKKDRSFIAIDAGNLSYRGQLNISDKHRWYIDISPENTQDTPWLLKGELAQASTTTNIKNL